jgi:hypothetical protein
MESVHYTSCNVFVVETLGVFETHPIVIENQSGHWINHIGLVEAMGVDILGCFL